MKITTVKIKVIIHHVLQIKSRRYKWVDEQYISILNAYFTAKLYIKNENTITYTYKIWKKSNLNTDKDTPTNRNNLANIWSYIFKTKIKNIRNWYRTLNWKNTWVKTKHDDIRIISHMIELNNGKQQTQTLEIYIMIYINYQTKLS